MVGKKADKDAITHVHDNRNPGESNGVLIKLSAKHISKAKTPQKTIGDIRSR